MSIQPHILIYSRHPEEFQGWLRDHGCPGTLTSASTPEAAAAVSGDIDVILCGRVPADVLECAPRLRWVQSMNAGIEDLLVSAAGRPDVVLTRIVDLFGGPIAEYVFAELLARVRELERLRAMQARREWEHFICDTLAGKTLGVAGLGSIGREIVRKGRAFDMKVYGLSRSGDHAGYMDRHFVSDAWVDFVRDLDVLVLTLPLTPETDGVVDAVVLGALPSRALVVNVGRGRLIDEDALIRVLLQGKIAGAVLDVFAQEPPPADSPFWTLPGVTVTPHVSGPSTVDGVGRFFLENLKRFLQGDELVGMIDRQRGY
jgi:glyoxylate/hydroxypyruvate reductase A